MLQGGTTPRRLPASTINRCGNFARTSALPERSLDRNRLQPDFRGAAFPTLTPPPVAAAWMRNVVVYAVEIEKQLLMHTGGICAANGVCFPIRLDAQRVNPAHRTRQILTVPACVRRGGGAGTAPQSLNLNL